jgi:hypothetical protein
MTAAQFGSVTGRQAAARLICQPDIGDGLPLPPRGSFDGKYRIAHGAGQIIRQLLIRQSSRKTDFNV